MEVIRDVDEMRRWRRAQVVAARSVALVPTMGYLHKGHLSLCHKASRVADQIVASIFVNPIQFGPNEDLEAYPRDEGTDLIKLADAGAAVAFLPSMEVMYPEGHRTAVEVRKLTEPLCGASRPGHFRGVATVVAKLFNIVRPDSAVFGLKDYQQYLVVRQMVRDLDMDIDIIGSPTVREPDGLAMSSRNAYLSTEGRRAATVLSRAWMRASKLYDRGERDPVRLRQRAVSEVETEPLARIDYIEVLDAETLEAASPERAMVVALAVFVEESRLIDNKVLGA